MSVRAERSELRVSTLEAFFDLVFAFTITRRVGVAFVPMNVVGAACLVGAAFADG